MAMGFSAYGRMLLRGAREEILNLGVPVLVWEAPPSTENREEVLLGTDAGMPVARPRVGEPIVYELRKSVQKTNAFAMGITLGRTENNDLVVDDNSVSRFHAWFQQDPRTHDWKVVDAESKYGTYVNGTKLSPNVATVLTDGARLRVGDVQMTYFVPASFLAMLEQRMQR